MLALLAVLVLVEAETGSKNLATAQLDLELGEGKQWISVTPSEAEELMNKEAALYAPKITCGFTPSSEVGFVAYGKSQTECGVLFGKAFEGIETHKGWKCDWAVVEGSEGKTVIAWCPFKYTLIASKEVISSTTMLKYEFDDLGKIIGYFQEFDTSRFALKGERLLAMPVLVAPLLFAMAGALMLVLRGKPEPQSYEALAPS